MNEIDPLPSSLFIPPNPVLAGLRFRLAVPTDLGPLYEIFYHRRAYAYFSAHFQKMIRRQSTGLAFWLVVELSAAIVGNGQLMVYPHGAELANLGVLPAHRDQGIGTAMIQILTAIARHIGLPAVEIGVKIENHRALALYERFGFSVNRRLQLSGQEPIIILIKAL